MTRLQGEVAVVRQEGGKVEKRVTQKSKLRAGLLALPVSVTTKLFSSYSTNKLSKESLETLMEA